MVEGLLQLGLELGDVVHFGLKRSDVGLGLLQLVLEMADLGLGLV